MTPTTTGTKRSLPVDFNRSNGEAKFRNRRLRTSPDDPDELRIAMPTLSHEDYTIVWVCALSIERAAAEAVFDEEHESLPPHGSDDNIYSLGRIAGHNVVVASLPEGAYGVPRAAHVLTNTRRTFRNLRYGLMVGIGGGVPGPNNDIRLGDVVVGTKVTPYGPAKVTESGRIRTEESVRPDESWLQVLSKVRSRHERIAWGTPTRTAAILASCFQHMPDYKHPKKEDNLFPAEYNHVASKDSECRHCDLSVMDERDQRLSTEPKVHYGTIASGDDLIKLGAERQRLKNELDILCFEMEAAGLMNIMRCLPVRGIADYADSHKNKAWQRYAAANAAGFAKEVLEVLPFRVNNFQRNEEEVTFQEPEIIRSTELDLIQARAQFLAFLKFERFDVRRKTMKPSYRSTCRWLLKQNEYRKWLDEPCNSQHGGFLWIKGNPGTGKSTLMKFAFEEESRRATKCRRQRGSKEVVASFFFNARGNDVEQSVEGMYRALILQILQEFADLQGLLDTMDTPTIVSEGITIVELEELFKSISTNLNGRRVTCFIDALDEGGRKQVVEMVKGFQDLFEYSTPPDSQLRICFSSRHYPYIEPRLGLQLILEKLPGHDEDLEKYVLGNLDIKNPVFKQGISTRLLEKARGIFLWTALVVDYLNEDISEGLSVNQSLSARLEEVPPGLHELFQHLLARHSSDMSTFRLMVAWLLFSRERLSPRQVDHALWSGSHGDALRNFDPPTFNEPDIDDRIRKRVISASKGLAEILATEEPTVNFIHESVRDFLLKDGGLKDLWPDAGDNKVTHHCHELLKNCCDQYLNHPRMAGALPLQSRPGKRQERNIVRQELLDTYPLLRYACQNVLWHADAAAYSLPQETFLSGIHLPDLTAMLNWMEYYKSRFYTPDHDLLSIIAHRGHAQLIRSWTGGFSVHYTYPMIAALSGRQETAFSVLMEKSLPGFQVTEYAGLVSRSARSLERKTCTFFSLAAECGCDKIVERLLQGGARVDHQNENWEMTCGNVLASDYVSTLRLLVRYGEGPFWNKDVLLQKCLHLGSEQCATWLLSEGADIPFLMDFRARFGRCDRFSALHMASEKGMVSTTRAIIEREVDVNELSVQLRQTPLHLAVRDLRPTITTSLIENGANVKVVDSVGQTPLHLAAQSLRAAAAEILLMNEADVNAVDINGQTPLMKACNRYDLYIGRAPEIKALFRYLFRYGAGESINHCDHWGQTALMLAIRRAFSSKLMRLFRDKGADYRVTDSQDRSLFWYAHESSARSNSAFLHSHRDRIFQMLIEWGVKPSIDDGEEVWATFRSLVPASVANVGSLLLQP